MSIVFHYCCLLVSVKQTCLAYPYDSFVTIWVVVRVPFKTITCLEILD